MAAARASTSMNTVVLGGFQNAVSSGATASAAATTVHLVPLVRSSTEPNNANFLVNFIRMTQPEVVCVELCKERLKVSNGAQNSHNINLSSFSSRRKQRSLHNQQDLFSKIRQRFDVLSNITGGFFQKQQYEEVLQASRSVHAAVWPIDRSVACTKNRVHGLLVSPKVMSNLFHYAAECLRRDGVNAARSTKNLLKCWIVTVYN